jgi:hypothetical protein
VRKVLGVYEKERKRKEKKREQSLIEIKVRVVGEVKR